jgi:hypothetical protein
MITTTLVGYLAVYAALLASYITTIFYLARHAGAPSERSVTEPALAGRHTVAGPGVAAAL